MLMVEVVEKNPPRKAVILTKKHKNQALSCGRVAVKARLEMTDTLAFLC